MNLPFPEQVTWHQYGAPTTDDTGNEIPAFTDVALEVAAYPTSSTESNQPVDVATQGMTLVMSGILPVGALDEFTYRGDRFRVDGHMLPYHSPWTGTELTEVRLLRRT